MDLVRLEPSDPDQAFWADVAARGTDRYHAAVVELTGRSRTLVPEGTAAAIIEDLTRLGFNSPGHPMPVVVRAAS
jgi:hypothetical protein